MTTIGSEWAWRLAERQASGRISRKSQWSSQQQYNTGMIRRLPITRVYGKNNSHKLINVTVEHVSDVGQRYSVPGRPANIEKPFIKKAKHKNKRGARKAAKKAAKKAARKMKNTRKKFDGIRHKTLKFVLESTRALVHEYVNRFGNATSSFSSQ